MRNLRAAGTATLTLRGARIPVVATEIDPCEAAPFIHATVAEAGRMTRRVIDPHFTASIDDPIETWEDEATPPPAVPTHTTPTPQDARPTDPDRPHDLIGSIDGVEIGNMRTVAQSVNWTLTKIVAGHLGLSGLPKTSGRLRKRVWVTREPQLGIGANPD